MDALPDMWSVKQEIQHWERKELDCNTRAHTQMDAIKDMESRLAHLRRLLAAEKDHLYTLQSEWAAASTKLRILRTHQLQRDSAPSSSSPGPAASPAASPALPLTLLPPAPPPPVFPTLEPMAARAPVLPPMRLHAPEERRAPTPAAPHQFNRTYRRRAAPYPPSRPSASPPPPRYTAAPGFRGAASRSSSPRMRDTSEILAALNDLDSSIGSTKSHVVLGTPRGGSPAPSTSSRKSAGVQRAAAPAGRPALSILTPPPSLSSPPSSPPARSLPPLRVSSVGA